MGDPLLPGDPRQLGRFYLDGRLGAGGQGVVYEGYDTDGRRVAVKVLRAVDGPDRDRLRREIQAWSKVEPYCTTKVLDADLDAATPYVVSEFVAGTDLRRAVGAAGPYGPEELRRLAVSLAAALVAIHQAGIVHRDFKPENILLGPDGPRVIDFGIARIMEGTATTGVPMGTLRYMPPERYTGEPGDGKVDVWGWAAVLMFAATGRDAFVGTSVGAVAYQVATFEPDTSVLPKPLDGLVRAAFAKAPADRPGAEELLLSLVGRADLASAVERMARGAGPQDAVPSRADAAEARFAALTPQEQEAVPSILLRLVAPGERAEDTLRSARWEEFQDGRLAPQVLERVVEAFTDAGVLLRDAGGEGHGGEVQGGEASGTVGLASAALIRSWPRLRDWVEHEREGLAVHQRLTEAARTWDDHGRRRGDLLQGTPLERARDWAATGRRNLVLSRTEQDFLEAGSALVRRRGRLRLAITTMLAFLLVVAAGAAGVAYDQWRTVLGQKVTLAGQLDRATSVQLASEALALKVSDPELARRLAVAAESLGDTPQAWSALTALRSQWEEAAFRLPTVPVTDLSHFGNAPAAMDDSGRVLLRATGAQVEIWDLRRRKRVATYSAPGLVLRLSVSGDGTRAVVVGEDDTVVVLDVTHAAPAAGAPVFRLLTKQSATNQGIDTRTVLSPHGNYLIDNGDVMTLWDTRTGKEVFHSDRVSPVSAFDPWDGASFSPDEKIASFFTPKSATPFTWVSLPDGKPIPSTDLGVKPADVRSAVAFSPDGQWVAIATAQATVALVSRKQPRLNFFSLLGAGADAVDPLVDPYPLVFSQDGRFLALAGMVWKTPAPSYWDATQPVLAYASATGDCTNETPYRFTEDDTDLVCLGKDDTVRVLGIRAITTAPTAAEPWNIYKQSAVNRNRTTTALVKEVLASTSPNAPDVTEVRPLDTPTGRRTLAAQPPNWIQLSPDGRLLAAWDDSIHLYDTALPGSPQKGFLPDYQAQFYVAAFSPDGRYLAVEGSNPAQQSGRWYPATLDYWDLRTMRKIRTVTAQVDTLLPDLGVFFAPDGKSVVATPYFGKVTFPAGKVLTRSPSDLSVDAMSDDGKTLFQYPTPAQPYLRTWDARTLDPTGDALRVGPVSPVDPSVLHGSAAMSAVSPDGRLYAAAQGHGSAFQVKLWSLTGQGYLGVAINGIVNSVVAVSFTPDGSGLVAVDEFGATYVAPVTGPGLARSLCAQVGQLTPAEWRAYVPDLPYRPSCPAGGGGGGGAGGAAGRAADARGAQ